ncbi:hypothetical protein K9O81_18555 [Leclercia adecarboxylata]|uniref:hypothetical protein n=1 Tax=Leclercia adecarboxylata TaxID=83655 RepID=UPI001CBF578E|nr:hypothetical protein [Leclercia adecarboxylata]MBZ3802466.1 hypothetical protein [Leclercia adecarboxylata]MBZ3807010.1 hypothetical protein [Leclercia adecarboxylata]
MVTYNTMHLNTPKSWDEFEDICKSSFQLRWHNPNLTRHGRSGQKQDGVDIYGHDNFDLFVGIQCKNTVLTLSNSVIDEEVAKAEMFEPPISALYIATTAPRDAALQAYVRKINQARHLINKFPVSIVFWDDITSDLTKDTDVLRQHYPQMFDQTKPTMTELLRNKDLSNLKQLVKIIDFPSTISALKNDAKYIHGLIRTEYEYIMRVVDSPVFVLDDHDLSIATNAVVKAWGELVTSVNEAPYNYLPHNDIFSFIMPGDFCRNKEEDALFDKITEQMKILTLKISVFCALINSNYREIDLNVTSERAREYY